MRTPRRRMEERGSKERRVDKIFPDGLPRLHMQDGASRGPLMRVPRRRLFGGSNWARAQKVGGSIRIRM